MNSRKTGLILAYSETVLNVLSGLFLSSFLLRSLGDFEYGLYQSMSAFVSYLVVLEFGIGTVMCRHLLVAKGADDVEHKKKITSTLWYTSVFLGAIIALAGISFGLAIGPIYGEKIGIENVEYAEKIFSYLMLYLLSSFFTQTLSGTYIGNENYYIGNTVNIIKLVLRTLTLTVAVISYPKAIVISLCDMAISIILLIFTLIYVRRKYGYSFNIRYFDKGVLKESLPLCVALLLQTVINQANNNVDKFVIGIKLDMESVSLYSVSMYVYTMFSSILTKPVTFFMPQVAENIRTGLKGKSLTSSMIPSGRLVALIGGTILFGFISAGKPFIEIVYGEKYIEAWLVALIVLVPTFLSMTGGNVINVLDILNKRQARSYILTVTTLINVILTVWFIDIWGIVGAAVATAISLVSGQLILLNIYYLKVLSINVWWLYLKSYKGILPSQILAACAGYVSGCVIDNPYISFLVGGTVFIIVEFILLMLFGFNKDERAKVSGLIPEKKKSMLNKSKGELL